MGLRLLSFFGLIVLAWGQPSISVSVADEDGNILNEKVALKIGQTILFRIKSPQPESVESVILETWNAGVSHYEGVTNNLSSENTFDIPFIVPSASVRANLSFDIVVRSKTGGRQHFFINKPSKWGIKENSFLESLVEMNQQLKVQGLSLDQQSPEITNVVSQKKKSGALVSFNVKDSHPDLTRMRVLDRPAKCVLLKGDSYRCETFVERTDSLKTKTNVEILALDRARNFKKLNVQNIYNPIAPIALAGPVLVESCEANRFDVRLSFKDNSSQLKNIEFLYFDKLSGPQRLLASESVASKKTKILYKAKEGNSLRLALKDSQKLEESSSYELLLKDKNLREFLYLLENEKPQKQSLRCEGRVLNPELVQIKEIQE